MFVHREQPKQERGAALVEYVVLIAGIAIVLVLSLNLLGGAIADNFSEAGDSLQNSVSVQDDNGSDDDSHDDDDD